MRKFIALLLLPSLAFADDYTPPPGQTIPLPVSVANGGTGGTTSTGSGAVVLATSPTLVTPALGTPSAIVLTNATGTAAGLTVGNVTTNANLTGPITSVGNATSIASQTGTGTKFVVDTAPTLQNSATIVGPDAYLILNNSNVSYAYLSQVTSNIYRVYDNVRGAEVFRVSASGGFSLGTSLDPGAANLIVQGTTKTAATIATGSPPTGSGTCAINTQTGGNTAGTFKANGACVAGTVILTFATTAPVGWDCGAHDRVTTTDILNVTGSTTTSITFTGTMANLDIVSFSCMGF